MSRIAIPAIEFSHGITIDTCMQARKIVHGCVTSANSAFSYLDSASGALVTSTSSRCDLNNYRVRPVH